MLIFCGFIIWEFVLLYIILQLFFYEAVAVIYKAVGYLLSTQISPRFHFEFFCYILFQ